MFCSKKVLESRTNKLIRFSRASALIDNEEDSDVIFLVGQEPDFQRVPAHSWILASKSPGKDNPFLL